MPPDPPSLLKRRAAAQWQFIQNAEQQWSWHRGENGVNVASSADFSEFGPCVTDAIKHGFRPAEQPYSTYTSGGSSLTFPHDARPTG